ncbi:putative zinc finger protein [Tripterygium wilfordii]|uniref:Putative zinc finger protein n=1 Tax=Tripterygium wilfordii TaxID=458696 RepID=A0A7J7DR88_TRIWF|nr:zinc finger protein CONSTANS-LIKE 2-like [Tripterygium wilfordii]KAF5748890.1 putative zinc finger protein [Tripterygium wilfordii]
MMKEESGTFDGVSCTNCSAYCQADGAYLCSVCDSRIHAANRVASCHERLLVCEACERAPAAFICKADAALLCTSCDADIHSANPLARRHHRVPISDALYAPPGKVEPEFVSQEAEEEAASWLLGNPMKTITNTIAAATNNNNQNNNINNGVLFNSGEGEEYLDFFEYNSIGDAQFSEQYNQDQDKQQRSYSCVPQKSSYGGDSVVPIQCGETKDGLQQQQLNFELGLGYEPSKVYSFSGSITPSVPISSLDVGVVPESTISDNSLSHSRPPKGTIDLFSAPPVQMPQQLSPMDREARVLRYREKKKTRKFEKTIRYASRKAYAETRARIKGRFTKRTDVEIEVDQMFSTTLMTGSGYGIVPSF